jgi:hypothetical protein
MEIFLPSLAALLIAALIVFLVLPRLGAQVLVGLSLILLVYCIYNHYKLFSSEYRYSTWQEQLKWYAPVVMYGAVTLGIIMYLGYLFSGSSSSSELPTTNVSADTIASVTNTINNTVNTVTDKLGVTNGARNNKNNGVLANLGGMLNSPKRNNNV